MKQKFQVGDIVRIISNNSKLKLTIGKIIKVSSNNKRCVYTVSSLLNPNVIIERQYSYDMELISKISYIDKNKEDKVLTEKSILNKILFYKNGNRKKWACRVKNKNTNVIEFILCESLNDAWDLQISKKYKSRNVYVTPVAYR